MSIVSLSSQIQRVAARVAAVERSLAHCSPDLHAAISRERDEWNAVLATLIGHRSANEAAGIRDAREA